MADSKAIATNVELVSATEIRRILAGQGNEPLSEKSISIFVADGMPKQARGMYDKYACARWYLGRLRESLIEKISTDDDGNATSLSLEKKRLVKAQADSEEMTANERRGVLIPIEVAIKCKNLHILVVSNKLKTLHHRMGSLADLSNVEAKVKMRAAVNSILRDLARTGAAEFEVLLAQSLKAESSLPKRGTRRVSKVR